MAIPKLASSPVQIPKMNATEATAAPAKVSAGEAKSGPQPSRMAKLPDGRVFYLTSQSKPDGSASPDYKAYLGKPGAMKELKLTDRVSLYRDGGSMRVTTEAGTMFLPYARKKPDPFAVGGMGDKPSWKETGAKIGIDVQAVAVHGELDKDTASLIKSLGIKP